MVWSPCWSFSPLWLSGYFFCYSASPGNVDKYDVKKPNLGSNGAFHLWCLLNGLRLILGTVIDTYMEEAQEELRSKRVKQSKGWDSAAFGTARSSPPFTMLGLSKCHRSHAGLFGAGLSKRRSDRQFTDTERSLVPAQSKRMALQVCR